MPRTISTRWLLCVGAGLCLALGSCSRKKSETESRKDPWLAQQPDAQTSVGLRATYKLEPRCEINVELPARTATPRGTFRVCKGELDVNLSDLAQSRGSLSVDLGSIEMRGEGDAGRSDDYTQRAQNWLDIGGSRPEAERERLRWATFTLSSASDASSETAHAGKLEKSEAPRLDPKNEAADFEADAAKNKSESRSLTLTAKGELLLHGVRVELSAPLRVVFDYPDRATSDRIPETMMLETRKPISVLLKVHDVKPRDSAGTLLSEEMKLFGDKIGTEAKVTFLLRALSTRAP